MLKRRADDKTSLHGSLSWFSWMLLGVSVSLLCIPAFLDSDLTKQLSDRKADALSRDDVLSWLRRLAPKLSREMCLPIRPYERSNG